MLVDDLSYFASFVLGMYPNFVACWSSFLVALYLFWSSDSLRMPSHLDSFGMCFCFCLSCPSCPLVASCCKGMLCDVDCQHRLRTGRPHTPSEQHKKPLHHSTMDAQSVHHSSLLYDYKNHNGSNRRGIHNKSKVFLLDFAPCMCSLVGKTQDVLPFTTYHPQE